MNKPDLEKRESRQERTDRIANEIIREERSMVDRKTARLRDMRLKMHRIATADHLKAASPKPCIMVCHT